MKINGQEFVIIGANPDDLAKFLNEQYPTREALIGSTIEAFGEEFIMLEQNIGMHWMSFFLQLMDIDTTGISATLGGQALSVSWTFKEST